MFTLPALEFEYDALGKYISKDIMELHHSKHHQTYVDKLNAAVDATPELAAVSLDSMLRDLASVPETVRTAVRNHGGGHYNHTLFWQFLSPNDQGEPSGPLADALKAEYGSFQAFVDVFTEKSLAIFGSGWAWLLPDMSIVTTPLQDNPISYGQPEPLIGLDVWEHAYYLDYTYKRADYVAAWWHVANWETAAQRYNSSVAK
ncbi:MAG: superoxide dismutase [Patescibacteria group bacterium]|nr:superoxide dismutase [Patescibacteria group bacterium]